MITNRDSTRRYPAGVLIAGATIACVVFLLVGWFASSVSARTDGDNAQSAGQIVPDLAVVVSGISAEDQQALPSRLNGIEGVARATADTSGDGTAVFYIARSDTGQQRSLSAVSGDVEEAILARVPEAVVEVGGSAAVDQVLSDPFGRSVTGVATVALAMGAALGLVFGWKRGAVTAIALPIAVLCAASIGSQVAGPFDGTITTTGLPGALAGLVGAFVVALRLLLWFRRADEPAAAGEPRDGAAMIRRSALDLLPELALVFSGLLVASMLVELFNSGRSPLTVVTLSSVVAIVAMVAILAPVLTSLHREPEANSGWLPLSFTDGRDFPLLVLSAIAMVLVAFSLFAFGTPSMSLLDRDRLSDDHVAASIADRLSTSGGDATSALVATNPGTATAQDFATWIAAVVEQPEVAWVDTADQRLRATGPVEIEPSNLLVPDGDERVVIVLNEAPRSEAGQQAAVDLLAIPLPGGPPVLSGTAVDAASVAGARGPILLAMVSLAVVAALGLYVLTQNLSQAITALVLRLVGGGATLGIFRLMVTDATMAESIAALALLALGLGLFELEFVRRSVDLDGLLFGSMLARRSTVDSLASDGDATANPGQASALGIAGLGLAAVLVSILALFGGGVGTGQFGLGVLVAVIIELLVGVVLLRPALLGQRAAFHTAVRPVRIALHSGGEPRSGSSLGAEDPVWRRTAGDLLQAEFRFQSEPSVADLESVFVRDTPLYRQAEAHHANLAQAGLRIVGKSPQLRSLRTVSGRMPITLAVTVDHPGRHLIDGNGAVVGVRKPERRSGVLWLAADADGSYRIAESVELGSVMLQDEDELVDDLDPPPAPTVIDGTAAGAVEQQLRP